MIDDILNKEFPQKCGDSLLVLGIDYIKSNSKNVYYKCVFKKYPYKISVRKWQLKEGNVYNPLYPDKYGFYLGGKIFNFNIHKIWKRNGKFRAYYNRKSLNTVDNFIVAKKQYSELKYKDWINWINKFDLPSDLREILLKYDFSWSWKFINEF